MRKNSKITTILVMILLLFILSGNGSILAERPYEGVELSLGLLDRSISDALRPYFGEFEEETGASIYMEQHAFDSLHDKMMLEFAAGTGYFDIVYNSPGYMGTLIENDYILQLDDYFEEYDIDPDEFLSAAFEINRHVGDETWGFPYLSDTTVMFYREDLFNDPDYQEEFEEEYGYELDVPETTDEFLDAAEFFTRDTTGDGNIDLYGFGYPQIGVAYGNLYIMPWIWTFGGEYYDDEFNSTLDQPEVLEAVEFAKELQQYQPAGVLGWEYGEHFTRFVEGDLAMSAGWFHMGLEVNDPDISDVAGDVGYVTMPYAPDSGLETGKTVLGGGGLAITADSEDPDAAFEYLKWMFADQDRAVEWFLEAGGFTMPAVLEDPAVEETYPWATDFFPVANFALENMAKQRPTLPEAHSIFEVTSEMWHNVAMGAQTPEEAVRTAHQRLNDILEPRQ